MRTEFPLQQVVTVSSHPLIVHLQEESASATSVTAHYQIQDAN